MLEFSYNNDNFFLSKIDGEKSTILLSGNIENDIIKINKNITLNGDLTLCKNKKFITSEKNKITQFVIQKSEELKKYNQAIDYFKSFGEKLTKEIIKVAEMSYKHGEIDFFQYITSLENATSIQVDYLDAVVQYNRIQNEISYLNY